MVYTVYPVFNTNLTKILRVVISESDRLNIVFMECGEEAKNDLDFHATMVIFKKQATILRCSGWWYAEDVNAFSHP